MSNSVVNTLCELGYVRDAELKTALSARSIRELITDFILPQVVEVGGQDTRGWRLSPLFMKLMTRHAQDFIAADDELGNLLFELAMQRIQRHPELKAIDYNGILPKAYQKYSAAYDQAGLWGDAEWAFMQRHLLSGLQLSNLKYREHCKALLLEIMKKVLPSEGYDSIGWFGMGTDVSSKELWGWAVGIPCKGIPVDEVIVYLLKDRSWRNYKKFLNGWSYGFNWEKFFANIDFDKEQYYRGVSRLGLKVLGLYGEKTKKCIKEEILRAKY